MAKSLTKSQTIDAIAKKADLPKKQITGIL